MLKIIITGGSRGIGKGIAAFLARNGFLVGLIARSRERLAEVKRAIEAEGGVCIFDPCDIRRPDQVTSCVDRLVESMGGLDALVNNAGLVIRKDSLALSIEEWQAMIETNVSGLFYTTRAVLPYMMRQQRGHIINVSSISGRVPLSGGSGYAATKYAVTGFSESLFLELRDYNIKVSTVFPGSVDTESHRGDSEIDTSWKVLPEDIGKACTDLLLSPPGVCISQIEVRPLRKPPAA